MSYRPSHSPQRPQSGRRGNQNAFAPLATDQDTDFVMDEVERGGERELSQAPVTQHPFSSDRESNWHRVGGWGSGETGTTSGTWGGDNEQHASVARQLRPLPPQGRAFASAAQPAVQRELPPPYIEQESDNQPVEWVGSIFQNTLGGLTPHEIRERAREHRRPSPPPQRPPSNDDYGRRRHRQPSPNPTGLVARLRAAGIDTPYEDDDDIPRGAKFVMEDMLFQLQQKTAEVTHLQKKVDRLREDSRVRKRADSDDGDRRPTKRREPSHPNIETSRDVPMGHPPPPTPVRAPQPPVETRERPAATTATRAPLAPTAPVFKPAISTQARDIVMRDDHPRPPLPPPRRAHGARQPEQPKPSVRLNGREYELGIEVTPPGTFGPDPAPTPDPLQSTPAVVDDDPYHFDESDHSSDDESNHGRASVLPDVGRVPDFWGVVLINNVSGWERDNFLRGMLSPNVYHSRRSNMVFTGRSAIEAHAYESRNEEAYRVPENPRVHVYNVTERGIPRRPGEIDKLITIVNNNGRRFGLRERAEAFLLLRELHRVASRVIAEYRDNTMNRLLSDTRFNPEVRPRLDDYLLDFPPLVRGDDIPRPGPPLPLAQSMAIDEAAFHTLLHNHPGSLNSTTGIAFDYAMRVGRRSMFGYALSRLITPIASSSNFRRQFAFLICLPRRYREAIVDYNRSHPHSPFEPQQGPDFNIHRARIPPAHSANVSQQDVINALLDNRIPPSWVDHAYPYGFIFLNTHYTGSQAHRGLIDAIDHERLERIRAYGLPPPIPAWDGWRTPSPTDILRVHAFMATEEAGRHRRRPHGERDEPQGQRAVPSSARWLLVGTDGVTEHLLFRPPREAASYAASHVITLPNFPELDPPPAQTATPTTLLVGSSGADSTNVEPAPSSSSLAADSTNVEPMPSSSSSGRVEPANADPPPTSYLVVPTHVDTTASPLSDISEPSEAGGV